MCIEADSEGQLRKDNFVNLLLSNRNFPIPHGILSTLTYCTTYKSSNTMLALLCVCVWFESVPVCASQTHCLQIYFEYIHIQQLHCQNTPHHSCSSSNVSHFKAYAKVHLIRSNEAYWWGYFIFRSLFNVFLSVREQIFVQKSDYVRFFQARNKTLNLLL